MLPVLAAILVLVGCFRLAGFSDLSVGDNVSKFQISFGFIALGYVLSWYFERRMMLLILLVAAVARIAMLPVAPGATMETRLWEGKVLDGGGNPYLETPGSGALERLRGEEWKGVLDKEEVSRSTPALLWAYQAAWGIGTPREWLKVLLLIVDLCLCLLFALRYGPERSVLYAWNPLVIYSIAGLGSDIGVFLLPLVAGFLLWEFWIDQKGGVSVITASGGIGSALGQMVCLSSLFIGLAAALNPIAFPMVLWIFWHVLKRSGFKAGLVSLVFGAAPLVLSFMWASISMNLEFSKLVPAVMNTMERSISLLPSIIGFIAGGPVSAVWYLMGLGAVTLWVLHNCDTLERFATYYFVWLLMLATAVYPEFFLLFALVGVVHGNWIFRVVSLSSFAYFGAYRVLSDTGAWTMPWMLQVVIWVPFLIAALQYSLGHRAKRGFYVHHF